MSSFFFQGTELLLDPTDHHWVAPEPVDHDGQGNPIYSRLRGYELVWAVMKPIEFSQLLGFFNHCQASGSIVAMLPWYEGSTYTFKAYSGSTLGVPTFDNYFEKHYLNVRMLVENIRAVEAAGLHIGSFILGP